MHSKHQQIDLILIYYNCRGKLQPIRQMLAYMHLPHLEIHLQLYHIQKQSLPSRITNFLSGCRVQKNMLPLLIHEGIFIYEQYPIMAYLCRRFNREDLLGIGIEQEVRVQEIIDLYCFQRPASKSQFFRVAQFAYVNGENAIENELKRSYKQMVNESGYVRELSEYLIRQDRPCHILGSLTIVDFIYFQVCLYMIGIFQFILQKRRLREQMGQILYQDEQYQNMKYLKIMMAYRESFSCSAYYIKNKDYLESKSILYSLMKQEVVEGLRKIWTGDRRFVV